jgi:hypothetical protein
METKMTTDSTKEAALLARIDAMAPAQREARLEELCATPSQDLSPQEFDEFYAMVFGAVMAPENIVQKSTRISPRGR